MPPKQSCRLLRRDCWRRHWRYRWRRGCGCRCWSGFSWYSRWSRNLPGLLLCLQGLVIGYLGLRSRIVRLRLSLGRCLVALLLLALLLQLTLAHRTRSRRRSCRAARGRSRRSTLLCNRAARKDCAERQRSQSCCLHRRKSHPHLTTSHKGRFPRI
jgi:hypothetical protein